MGHCGSVGPRQSGTGSAIAAPWGAAVKDNGGGRSSGNGIAGERLEELENNTATTNPLGRMFGWRPQKRLQAVCMPALQEHQPPLGVHPLYEENDEQLVMATRDEQP
jgi:hypothetical protein